MGFVNVKRLLLIVRRTALGAFKPFLVSMGVILDESMLIALEGVEGEGAAPTWAGSISYEDTSIKFQYYLLEQG